MPYAAGTKIRFDYNGKERTAKILAEAKGRYYVDMAGATVSVLKKMVKGVAK